MDDHSLQEIKTGNYCKAKKQASAGETSPKKKDMKKTKTALETGNRIKNRGGKMDLIYGTFSTKLPTTRLE